LLLHKFIFPSLQFPIQRETKILIPHHQPLLLVQKEQHIVISHQKLQGLILFVIRMELIKLNYTKNRCF
jgi:hypothetical protein